MAKATLLDHVVKTDTDAGVDDNGVFHLYTSEKVNVNAGDNAVEIVVKYEENVPNPAASQIAKYNLIAILETQDEDGTWHPFHGQYDTFVNPEDGSTHVIKLDPNYFSIDAGVSNSISNGFSNIAIESRKQGTLPDDFRVCVLVNDYSYVSGVAGVGAFEQVKLTVTYNTYSV